MSYNPQLVLDLSLLFGSFSLCPHSGRLTGSCDSLYVSQISIFQNFPLWLIWTSSLLSIHPYYMASDPSGKHHGDLLFPFLATNWPSIHTQVHPKSSLYHLYTHFMSVTKILCLWNQALFIVTYLTSNYLGQPSLVISEVAISN